jgi:hypothetical protein
MKDNKGIKKPWKENKNQGENMQASYINFCAIKRDKNELKITNMKS